MWLPCPPRIERIALAVLLSCLTTKGAEAAELESNDLAWSLSTPRLETAPRSFPAIAIHVLNRAALPRTLRLHFVSGPLRALSGSDFEVALGANEETTALYTLYVPPEVAGGSDIAVTARADNGIECRTSIRIKSAPSCKVTADSLDTRFVRPGEKASYKLKIANTGNVTLRCTMSAETSPRTVSTTVTPENLSVPAGASAEASIEVLVGEMTAFTSFVTSATVQTVELSGDDARQFLYFHTEAFPEAAPPDHTHLFETLKGSALVALGPGSGNQDQNRGAEGVFRETLTLEGLITDNTRLQLIESFAHPSTQNGNQSSALSSLPSGGTRNFFHLGFYNPWFDLEGGEITTAPTRLTSSRETGNGFRAALRPLGNEKLQLEVFGEENTLTLNREKVFGATASGAVLNSPLEWWRVGTLSKRGDTGPQGRDWNALGLDTGWRLPLTMPLRAEVSVAAGENSVGQSGLAWLAGLHYNRLLPGETDTSPLKAGVEFAFGDKDFPGAQNGRDDRRAYLSWRFSSSPTYLEAYATYNDSDYQVVPKIEKTLEEEQSLLPDFLLTSQSRLINAGVRWQTLNADQGGWHLPAGNAEFQETSYFNQSDFFDTTDERAVALNIHPFEQVNPTPGAGDWQLNLLSRGGTESDDSDGGNKRDSNFFTLGADFNVNRSALEFLDRIGGPGSVSAQLSGRYTVNLNGDTEALNRTGLSVTASANWQTATWLAKTGTTIYSYVDQGFSERVWASITRNIGKDWWAGIEGAYTHRSNGGGGSGQRDESAVLFTFRHDFEVPVPWLPRRGQAAGRVFNDMNNNGRQDLGEPGLAGVKVAVGKDQALSGPDGAFSLSPMTNGAYPITVTPPGDIHLAQSSDHPATETVLRKGDVTQLAIGMIEPTTIEGKVRFVRELSAAALPPNDAREDLSGLEIICTDAAGRVMRSAPRADGFFAIYLEPGSYEVRINSETLKAQQVVSPEKLILKVEHSRIENLTFTVTERTRRIRKTFSKNS